jgi:pyruvyl transferase EpsI
MDLLYPVRRIHGWLFQIKQRQTQKSALKKYLNHVSERITLIPGTPEHSNLGDSAIVIAQMEFLKNCGVDPECIKEVTFAEYKAFAGMIKKQKVGLVAQLGGGNMGSQWLREEYLHRQITADFSNTPMQIFPQTIYYTEDAQGGEEKEKSVAVYEGHEQLTMVARETQSLRIMQQLYPNTKLLLAPDIVLSGTMDTFGVKPQRREGILLCMREDVERSLADSERQLMETVVRATGLPYRYTDTHCVGTVTKDNRRQQVKEKMEELASAQLVITDRLHGMVFAAITGTPCIVFGNYNHKVRGTYEWIKHLPYIRYAETATEAQALLPELLKMDEQVYDNGPLKPYFEELAQVVRAYAED